jgi:hypothetical protein
VKLINHKVTAGSAGAIIYFNQYQHNPKDYVTAADENGHTFAYGYESREHLTRVSLLAGDIRLSIYDGTGKAKSQEKENQGKGQSQSQNQNKGNSKGNVSFLSSFPLSIIASLVQEAAAGYSSPSSLKVYPAGRVSEPFQLIAGKGGGQGNAAKDKGQPDGKSRENALEQGRDRNEIVGKENHIRFEEDGCKHDTDRRSSYEGNAKGQE